MRVKLLGVAVVRWAARALALATFIFWGWFFAVQLQEWVVGPLSLTEPLGVWVGQTLYVLILAGLAIGLKWELAGGLLVVGASVLLFADRAPQFIPLAILPGLLYIACWFGGLAWREQPAMCDDRGPTPRTLEAA